MTHDTQHLGKDEILEKTEQFLNFKFDRIEINTEVEEQYGLYGIHIRVSPDRNHEQVTYQLEACPICGHIQAVNFSAYKKNRPREAEQLLKEKRIEQAEKYKENGTLPDSDKRLKNRIETAHLNWNNTQCERRHPPR